MFQNRFLFFVIITFVSLPAFAGEKIKLFVSDGCSAFPDGTISEKNLWLDCCVEHDKAYWMGGTYDERLLADKELQKCVEKVGKPKIAALMLAGVRVGGTPYLPTKFRWGYGWSYPRGYGELSGEEKLDAQKKLNSFNEK